MDFFGDYSIETASCHPSSIRRTQEDAYAVADLSTPLEPLSPRDTRTSYPIDLANVSNLARAFSLQNLESSNNTHNNYENEYGANYTFQSYSFDGLPSPTDRPGASASSPLRTTPPCWKRRLQRQRDTRLHCDVSHLRSISELVERMVDEGDQCETKPRRRPSIIALPHSTASFDDDDEDESISSDPSTPRSLSGSSSNGRRPSYFADLGSPGLRRSGEALSSTKSSGVQKVRHRRSAIRERR